ncbi:Ig-like domain-containing protein [Pseudoalteromonas byunsanensis]|uniref:Dystroglycan-type cadherin-like domain-containing protein n=1 Tax=Pseudoalteromonas byunsanensis TaxID=327939 RepID=A0A1S1N5J5_9GAMM|nr:Ig-like domain-containing protein [Pseudoalteromonas byunsanensis]OHU94935.1 hypothetical protein BIW53_13020 [Pseudoalteromonas byunsanensis]
MINVKRRPAPLTWLLLCFICLNVFAQQPDEINDNQLLVIDSQVQSKRVLEALSISSNIMAVDTLLADTPHHQYGAIHLFSHGGPGWLLINGKTVHVDSKEFNQLVTLFDTKLTATGSLFLYGCDLAVGEGKQFVDVLSKRLNRTVYASTNKTGNPESDGDWRLEYSSNGLSDSWQLAEKVEGFQGVLVAPNDVTFQNGGPALLSNPVTFDSVTYSHNLPATGKMARYNDSVTGNDNFGTADGQNADNILLYHMSDGGTLDAPTGDIDFRFKTSSGDEFKLVSMEAGSISNEGGAVSNSINYVVTITGYRDSASVVSDTIDFQVSDSANSVTYTKNNSYNDGVLTFDSEWQNIDEVRFTTSGKSAFVTFVQIDTIDFEAAVSDTTPPVVSSLDLSSTHGASDSSLTYTITFDESVANVSIDDFTVTTVTGDASGTVSGVSASSGSSMDITVSSITGTGSLRLDLNANTNIVDGLGNGNNTNGYVATFNGEAHTVDRDAPTVSSVTSSDADGTYKTGDSLSITVTFTESVSVTGTPTLTLETGATDRTAAYSSGSGTSILTFTYTVQSGDESSDLAYGSTSALALAGGTITDSATNAATLTLPTPGAANSLSNNKALVIDGVGPAVSSVSSTTTDGTYVAGDVLTITVTFDDTVAVTGTPELTLETGTNDTVAIYSSGSGGTVLSFNYTVQSGDTSSDLDYLSTSALALAGGSISDASGNVASLTLPSLGAVGSLSANKALVIDGVAPTLSSVSSSTANGTYSVGDIIAITVEFSEAVSVTGTPTLTLETGATDRAASYSSGSGGTTLSFVYTVQTGDSSSDLAYVSTSALALSGGTINDTAGNAASLTLATPGTANSLSANKAIVIDGVAPTFDVANSSPVNGSYGHSVSGSITLKFSENVAFGSGSIMLISTASSTVIENFEVTSAAGDNGGFASISADTVTINPGSNFSAGESYAIQVAPSAITDVNGNEFAGINDNTSYTFTVAANVAMTVDNTDIAENAGVAVVSLSLVDAAGTVFNAPDDVVVQLSFGGTATGGGTDYSLSGGISGTSVTISASSGSQTFSVTGVDDAPTADNNETVVVDIDSIKSGNATESGTQSVTITLTENASPTLAMAQTLSYSENSGPRALDVQAAVNDPDGDTSWQGNGAQLVASITTNGLSQDILMISTIGGFSISSGQLSYQNTVVGSLTDSSGTANDGVVTGSNSLMVNLTASTNAITQELVRALSYQNSSDAPSTTTRTVTVQLTDSAFATVSDTVTVNVSAVNDAPSISGTPPSSVVQGGSYSFTPSAQDVDSNTLTFSISNKPSWASFNTANGALTGNPVNSDVGTTTGIVISVSDGVLSSSLAPFNLSVTDVNDAPTIIGTPTTSIEQGVSYSFTPQASDVDGDTLIFSIVNQPSWTSFDNSTGTLSGTPENDDVGTTTGIVISVSDDNLTASLPAFGIQVININDAPTISGSPDTTALQDSLYSFTPQAGDVDGDTLTFSVSSQPSWLTFDTSTGELSGTPTQSDVGSTTNIVITVSDGSLSASLTFDLTVVEKNTAPVATAQSLSVDEDSTLAIIAKGEDEQQDTLSFAIVNAPENGTLSTSNNGWTYQPNVDFNGQDSFSYTASDEELTSEPAVVNITVVPVNDAPVAVDDAITQVLSDSDLYSLAVLNNDTDVDGDSLNIVGANASIGSVSIVDDTLSYQALSGFSGEVQLSYVISDGNKGRDTANVDLRITGPSDDDKPILTLPDDIETNAVGLYTKVDLGVASAVDSLGNPVPVSLVEQTSLFPAGVNNVYWQATDSKGLQTRAKQTVIIHPIISLSKNQVVTEGNEVTVYAILNGTAPSYPLTVAYSISGTADSQDHNAQAGSVTFTSGTIAPIKFTVFNDDLAEDPETVEVSLSGTGNFGNKRTTTIRILEGNIAPMVELSVMQNEQNRLTVSQAEGAVTVTATAKDANQGDVLSSRWNSSLTAQSTSDNTFTFDPSNVEPGVYSVVVTVSDNGVPSLSAKETVYIDVVTELVTLGNDDEDGDLIPDSLEGYADEDGDGIADYLDAINECNVVPEQVVNQVGFLAEGDPGVCLRKGAVAALNNRGGLQLQADNQQAAIGDDDGVSNVGGIFDYIAYGLPEPGQTYRLVLPQRLPIPANAVYRKFTQGQGWKDFVEDANNRVFSSAGEPGYCPPPGGEQWQLGMTEGHWCIQLEVEDGGPNDADAEVNGTIVDPSGVGVYSSGNQIPVANEDTFTMPWNSSAEFDVLANDTDSDGDTLSIVHVSAQFGSVEITPEQLIRYTSVTNFAGIDVISYSISDAQGGTGFSSATITIVGNMAPIAVDDNAQTANRSLVVIDVLANDSDPDGDELSVTLASALNGRTFINDGKTIGYVPQSGFAGDDTLTYRISDGKGGIGEAQVIISVAENQPPVANANIASGDNISTILIDVLGNDTDPEMDEITVISASAEVGSVSVMSNGLIRYTPKSGYVGMDTIRYVIADEFGAQAQGIVNVSVTKPVSDGSGGGSVFWLLLMAPLLVLRKRAA